MSALASPSSSRPQMPSTRGSVDLPASNSNKPKTKPSTSICWKFQKGICSRANCRYRHIKIEAKSTQKVVADRRSEDSDTTKIKDSEGSTSIVTSAPSSLTTTQKASSSTTTPTTTKSGLPPKPDCKFCPLGLCVTEHVRISSLIVQDKPGPSNLRSSTSRPSTSWQVNKRPPVSPPRNTKVVSNAGPSSNNTSEEFTLTLLKSTRVTFGKGLQVKKISTSFESHAVTIGNLPKTVAEKDIRNLTKPYGEVLSVDIRTTSNDKKGYAIVRYGSPSEAAAAVEALNGTRRFSVRISANLRQVLREEVGKLHSCMVRIDMPGPGMDVYAGYETKHAAEQAAKVMHGATYKNHVLAARMHFAAPRVGPFTVKYEGVPHNATEKDIEKFNGGKDFTGAALFGRVTYQSLACVVNNLKQIIENYGKVISMDVPKVPPVNGRLRGIIRFASEAEALEACAALNRSKFHFLGREQIYLSHSYKIIYKIPTTIFRVILNDLRRLVNFATSQPGASLVFYDKNTEQVDVEIIASHLDSLKAVKGPLERMIAGKILKEDGKNVWHDFFASKSGKIMIDTIGRESYTYGRVYGITGCIKFWGSTASVEQAMSRVLNKIKLLRMKKEFAIPLQGKLLLNVLMSKTSHFEDEWKGVASIDLENHRLVINGDDSQLFQILGSISSQMADSGGRKQGEKGNNDCPVCLDTVVDSTPLNCGHIYCRQCINNYLISSSEHRKFPLKCLGDGNKCTELLPLTLCQRILQKEEFSRLVEASFSAYIQTHPEEFHYCPSPDCPQVYRDAPGPMLQCPTCLVNICTSCHEIMHEGVACRVSNEVNDKLFNEWRETHNVKSCPRCTSNIEKIAGCNHVMCANCSTHMCWECMSMFKESKEVYDHMVKEHKGIGL